jgi:hypothetical protein
MGVQVKYGLIMPFVSIRAYNLLKHTLLSNSVTACKVLHVHTCVHDLLPFLPSAVRGNGSLKVWPNRLTAPPVTLPIQSNS